MLFSVLRRVYFVRFLYLLRFPPCKLPLSFLALIESENIGENAPRYDLNFSLRNGGVVYQFLFSAQ